MQIDSDVGLEKSNQVKNNSSMAGSSDCKTENIKKNNIDKKNSSDGNNNSRRQRINRLKLIIILVIMLLLLLPSICCIVLLFRVSRLEQQVNQITATYGMKEMTDSTGEDKYAYAAVKSEGISINCTPIPTPLKPYKAADITEIPNKSTYSDQVQAMGQENNTSRHSKENAKKTGIYSGKKIYLTFDDGPSIWTDRILDILAENNVKATFFVIGKTDKESKELYRRIVREGHTLGMHSYSHRYEKIYNSLEDFDKDFTKLWKLLYDTTGYKPSIYRFPGGSDNSVNENGMEKFVKYLNNKHIVYFDWNVVNGDATSVDYTQEKLVNNVLDNIVNKDRAIVLLHDTQTKKATVDSLPELIKKLISGGAQLLPLEKDVKPIQMMKADSKN